MSLMQFTTNQLSAALARGVRQLVVVGAQPISADTELEMFAVGEAPLSTFEAQRAWTLAAKQGSHSAPLGAASPTPRPSCACPPEATFVPTHFDSETLAQALEKSEFDKLKATLVVWLGSAGYRTVDAMIASLAFIASLPKGSGVLLDYAVERTSLGSLTQTAMDALASRISSASGPVKYLIHPQAVTALLRGVGFQEIVDLGAGGGHLVSAVV
jgi:leucine carboxyl methyltransferase